MTIEKNTSLFWGLIKMNRPMEINESFDRHFRVGEDKEYSSSLRVLDSDTVAWITDYPNEGRSYCGPEINEHKFARYFDPSLSDHLLGRTTTITWKPDEGE